MYEINKNRLQFDMIRDSKQKKIKIPLLPLLACFEKQW